MSHTKHPLAILPPFMWRMTLPYLPRKAIIKFMAANSRLKQVIGEDTWKSLVLNHHDLPSSQILIVQTKFKFIKGFWARAYINGHVAASIEDMFARIQSTRLLTSSGVLYFRCFINTPSSQPNDATRDSEMSCQDCYIELLGSKTQASVISSNTNNSYGMVLVQVHSFIMKDVTSQCRMRLTGNMTNDSTIEMSRCVFISNYYVDLNNTAHVTIIDCKYTCPFSLHTSTLIDMYYTIQDCIFHCSKWTLDCKGQLYTKGEYWSNDVVMFGIHFRYGCCQYDQCTHVPDSYPNRWLWKFIADTVNMNQQVCYNNRACTVTRRIQMSGNKIQASQS